MPTLISEFAFEAYPTAPYYDTLFYDDSCQSYWRFNSASALDDDKDVSDGTLSGGPSLVSSLLPFDSDQALSFDGVDDYASVPSTSALLQAGSWTFEGLVKFAALPGAVKTLATKGSWSVEIRADGLLQFSVINHVSGVATKTTVVGTTPLEVDTAYHVELIHDATAQEIRIALNGRVEATESHTVGTELWGLPLLFGAKHGGTAPTFGAAGATFNATPAPNIVVSAPSGIAAGHLLVCHLEVTSTSGAVTPPSGWSTLYSVTDSASNVTYVFYKLADAGDVGAASYTFAAVTATGNAVAVISRYTGVDQSNPFANPPYANLQTASGTSYSTGARIPLSDDVLLLGMFSQDRRVNFTSSATERYDTGDGLNNVGRALYLATTSVGSSTSTSIDITAGTAPTAGQVVGIWVALKGADAQDFCAVELDEWALLAEALDADTGLDHSEARSSGTGSWTDVTSDSRGVETSRQRQYELDRMEPGTLQETLNDPNRDYDASNTDGAHYPNVKTKRRHRVRAVVGAETFPLIDVYVDKWPQTWLMDGLQTVELAGSDGMAALNLAPVSGDVTSGLTGAQIHRLLDLARWPRELRDIDDGQFLMAGWTLGDNAKAGPSIQELVDSELGVFFMSAAGVATFHDYAHRWSASRSLNVQATFSDQQSDIDAGAIPYLIGGVDPSFDDDTTINEWTVSTAGGSSVTVRDIVGSRQGFPLAQSRSTRLSSIVDAETQALALLQHTARAGQRFDKLTAAMGSPRIPDRDAAWQTLLGLEISDRVRFIRTPTAGSPIVVDCFVEGVDVTAPPGPASWTFSLALSPVSPASFYETAVRSEPRSYYRMDEL